MLLDDKAKEWLATHQHELEPEEILSEEEKQKRVFEEVNFEKELMTGYWPVPVVVQGSGEFENIGTHEGFVQAVSNPKNWKKMLGSPELYYRWILPNAILLFGKPWFDKAKWRSRVCGGTLFPLFTRNEKNRALENGIPLENTPPGRARIAKIVSKISHALRTYLGGEWYDGVFIKSPGGYLVNAIRNDFTREIGKDMGFRLTYVAACPYCLSAKCSYKVQLIYHGSNTYSCPRCKALLENSKPERICLDGKQEILDYHQGDDNTAEFYGTTCVCPSDTCVGKFVPLLFSEDSLLNKICREYVVAKGTNRFYLPPEEMLDIHLKCPFCQTNFTPRTAIELKSGFKQKSGYLTGLPTMTIWQNSSDNTEDINELSERTLMRSADPTMSSAALNVIFEQRVDILIGELTTKMSKLNTMHLSDLHAWCFYSAAIEWMRNYSEDAARYFFDHTLGERKMTEKERVLYPGKSAKRITNTVRGQDVAIHQSFFQVWMDLIERNIGLFTALDPNIVDISDLGWFCRSPKFTGGPVSRFRSEVGGKKRIANKTEIFRADGRGQKPRLAKILSIHKVIDDDVDRSYNYINSIRFCEWHAIQLLTNSPLKFGDTVEIEALVMPGHHTHAPIQRILRLRKNVLGRIIAKVVEEERTGVNDAVYWAAWKKAVKKASAQQQRSE
jgi:hypothetical protein